MAPLARYLAQSARFKAPGEFIIELTRQSGQGLDQILLIEASVSTYPLGEAFDLTLAPAAPALQPIAVPNLAPEQIPPLLPIATPGMVPQPIKAPMLVPSQVPSPLSQVAPPLQQLTPQPMAVPQQTPYAIPAPMSVQAPYLVPQHVAVPQQAGYITPPPMLSQATPYLVPQLQEPSALANQAYIAARYEAAAHAQMAAEVEAMKAAYRASLDKTGKPGKVFTPEEVKTLEEVIEIHKGKKGVDEGTL